MWHTAYIHVVDRVGHWKLTYLLTYLLTPRSTVLLERLTGFQLVKKSTSFYGTRRFITAFTISRHLPQSWASSIRPMPPYPTSWRSILILSYLRLGLPSGLFPSGSPTNTLYMPLLSHMCYMPRQSHSSRFYHPHNIRWGVQIIKLFICTENYETEKTELQKVFKRH